MKKAKKLSKNFDPKILSVNHVGSRGEGVAELFTEFDYKEKNYNFFIPFSFGNEKGIKKL